MKNTQFKDLKIGNSFDFISPDIGYNSFFERCTKVSMFKYVGESGGEYRIGSTTCIVYHVTQY
jgi:hypothetical protein